MMTKEELCKKITDIYPDIGICGIDLNVDYSDEKGAWVVDLKQKGHHLQTFLENNDARKCMEGKQCVSLGLHIAELVDNIKKM
ncbi:MAG: hypothetical protein KKD73_14435 [Proteobacteria bacterium]|nr:hypothetical protein [Pseudomonadota bacterium]MBU1641274.1 hypothetical protein [Pseudomonadota bacterium]